MTFSIGGFFRTNKVFFIWVAFGSLLFLFREMFGLVFITYIMCFIAHGLVHRMHRACLIPRRVLIVVLYLVFLLIIVGFLFFITPRLISEGKGFTEQIPTIMATVEAWIESKISGNQMLQDVFVRVKEQLVPSTVIASSWSAAFGLLQKSVHYISWFFLGLLFSFLIMLDLPRLTRSVRRLRYTRLSSVVEETSGSVVLFARVVGEAFRAQIFISTLNTALTAVGLYFLGIQGIVLLCTVVFFCGLIPVLGVFISSVPILLMAVNAGGIPLALWALVLIVVIHLVEAYVFNPRIMSAVMRINPVMVLIILYIAHSLIGVWGMLLGVPISVYVYRQLIVGSTPAAVAGAVSEAAAQASMGCDGDGGPGPAAEI